MKGNAGTAFILIGSDVVVHKYIKPESKPLFCILKIVTQPAPDVIRKSVTQSAPDFNCNFES